MSVEKTAASRVHGAMEELSETDKYVASLLHDQKNYADWRHLMRARIDTRIAMGYNFMAFESIPVGRPS
jgi:hypothetical protein